MPDYAKLSQNYQEAKAARLNSGSPFKSRTEINLKKSAEQAMLDDIGQRYKAKIVVKIEKHQDYLAFGKPDMSYPGKVVIAEEGRATVFDATNLGASTRTKLTRSEDDLAVFHLCFFTEFQTS